MREILFRGQNGKGEWEYGTPLIGGKDCKIAYIAQMHSYNARVNPETISQYVWRVDAKGRRVFEGDIIRSLCPNDDEKNPFTAEYFEIFFNERSAAFAMKVLGGGKRLIENELFSQEVFTEFRIEVIGNRWETQEVLKKMKGAGTR